MAARARKIRSSVASKFRSANILGERETPAPLSIEEAMLACQCCETSNHPRRSAAAGHSEVDHNRHVLHVSPWFTSPLWWRFRSDYVKVPVNASRLRVTKVIRCYWLSPKAYNLDDPYILSSVTFSGSPLSTFFAYNPIFNRHSYFSLLTFYQSIPIHSFQFLFIKFVNFPVIRRFLSGKWPSLQFTLNCTTFSTVSNHLFVYEIILINSMDILICLCYYGLTNILSN